MGPSDNFIQSMDKWNDIRNVFFLSLPPQTLQLFNEYGVETFNYYKYSGDKTNFEYVMTAQYSRTNLKKDMCQCWM